MTTLKLNRYENYVTDDPAEVNFGARYGFGKADNFPAGPPTAVKVVNAMRDGDGDGKLTLDLSRLTYVASVEGGLRNPDSKSHRYTTDYQKYHLYVVDDGDTGVACAPDSDVQFGRGLGLVIVSVNGGGNRWVMVDYCDRGNSVLFAARHLPKSVAEDILTVIFAAYGNGHSHGSRTTAGTYKRAFVDGTLKKRKVRGESAVKVWIESPPADTTGPVVIKVGGPSAFD